MAYRQLTEATLASYLSGLPEIRARFSSFDELDIQEVSDGNLNFVFLVTNRRSRDETVTV
ncbi:MAG: hypothetical protein ACTSWI_00455 [Alphaproteobacteria bacterium]